MWSYSQNPLSKTKKALTALSRAENELYKAFALVDDRSEQRAIGATIEKLKDAEARILSSAGAIRRRRIQGR